jgi:hypothetical protein
MPDLRSPAPPFGNPGSIGELGIPESLIDELFLKHALVAGNCTLGGLSNSLKLAPLHVEAVFRRLRSNQLLEVKGTWGEDYAFTLTNTGRSMAAERMRISPYAGPLPVPLAHYELAVRSQVWRTQINHAALVRAYDDLSLKPDLLARLGPALVSGNSMFLYGPSGTGKTSLAVRIPRVLNDTVAIPWAVEVEGNIISIFDCAVHNVAGETPHEWDPRWLICERPLIMVGGELVHSMLELRRDADAGICIAPPHMKANNGIFVIDDFGRQLISPRDLLNRWIVPLDRRTDYLSTPSGVKFHIPFEVFVVFATNLEPANLADEAFLRRIPNKIFVDVISAELFDTITSRRMAGLGWREEPAAREHLRAVCVDRNGDLRPCYPRDLLQIIEAAAQYEEHDPVLSKDAINQAADLYFAINRHTARYP